MPANRTIQLKTRRLGAELRRLRTQAGMTLDTAARELGCTGSKLSRQECGKAGIRAGDLDRLLDLYEVSTEERDELRALLGERNVRDWWLRYDDVLTPSHSCFLAMENDASAMLEYHLAAVPGLLQTRDYARATNLEMVRALAPEQVEATVEVRLRRQRRLIEEPRLTLHALIWEGALSVETGGTQIMREQIRYLLLMSALPNIELQIVPFSAGRRGLLSSSFQILTFPDPRDPDQLFVESLFGTIPRTNDREVARSRALFDQVAKVGLSPSATRSILAAHAKGT
ncbi:helix-turn-helix domain-containing protein [Streptomycetaceae bacterium NBC_01309]